MDRPCRLRGHNLGRNGRHGPSLRYRCWFGLVDRLGFLAFDFSLVLSTKSHDRIFRHEKAALGQKFLHGLVGGSLGSQFDQLLVMDFQQAAWSSLWFKFADKFLDAFAHDDTLRKFRFICRRVTCGHLGTLHARWGIVFVYPPRSNADG